MVAMASYTQELETRCYQIYKFMFHTWSGQDYTSPLQTSMRPKWPWLSESDSELKNLARQQLSSQRSRNKWSWFLAQMSHTKKRHLSHKPVSLSLSLSLPLSRSPALPLFLSLSLSLSLYIYPFLGCVSLWPHILENLEFCDYPNLGLVIGHGCAHHSRD